MPVLHLSKEDIALTYKQKTEMLVKQYNCTVDKYIPPARPEAWYVEILPPDGYTFDGLSCLVCRDWKDAYHRIQEVMRYGAFAEGEML